MIFARWFVLTSCLSPDDVSSRLSRRKWLSLVSVSLTTSTSAAVRPTHVARAESGELPSSLKDYTKLAPLGPVSSPISSKKTYGLSLEELAARLTNDLTRGATGKGSYIITGDLSRDIFRDDCVFQDPTNRVKSLAQYNKALKILFDPDESEVQVLGPLRVDKESKTISGRFRSRGFLQLPWKPFIKAYESDIVYRVDDDGLIFEQNQHWTKSSSEALRESFTPSIFSPGQKSTRLATVDEPQVVTALFDLCNGRRPTEYSDEEQGTISKLLETIQASSYPWDDQLVVGKWKVAYIQPGPTGVGIDRRGVPFPEFSFNDQYQIFSADPGDRRVTNVGELFGPSFFVRVAGSVFFAEETSRQTPKTLRADIKGGDLCFQSTCLPLPIQGSGLLDILYSGERLRVIQSRDGGGAVVVQINMA